MTDRRRPAHPLSCECEPCRFRRDESDMGRLTCDTCEMGNRCDGRLRVQSLTDHLTGYYLDKGDRSLVDAMARACLQYRAKA